MSEPAPARAGWALPVLLAVSTSAAVGLAYLYLVRPNAGELGAVRVVVSDEDGKSGNTIRVVVSEAPLVQKGTASPGTAFTGIVRYPVPYLTEPNLKLVSGKRRYSVTSETKLGFTWVAEPLPEDKRGDAKSDASMIEQFLGLSLATASAQGRLKPGLVFEDFTWEAQGLRAPPSAIPPNTFEQKGSFATILGQEGVVFFPVPYASPPHVGLSGTTAVSAVVITECTANGFRWRNVGDSKFIHNGDVNWVAKGVLGTPDPK
jgi:hypothetical protein